MAVLAGGSGCAVLLLVNALLPAPALWPLFTVTAVMMAAAALQRPSLDASVPRLVAREQLTAASALLSLSQTASFLLGSALGGALAVTPAPWLVYAIGSSGREKTQGKGGARRRRVPPGTGPMGS